MDAAQSTHPTDQTLSSFALGRLDDRSAQAVNEHLMECSDCRKRAAEMSADSFLQKVRDAQKPSSESAPRAPQSDKAANTLTSSSSGDSLPPELATHPDYEIKQELGRGGMGVVYLAYNRMMGRDEVLKVMGQHLIDAPEILKRFRREIHAVAKLRHPNIVTAYHATRLGHTVLFAMEYVEGLDLSKLVKAKGPMPVAHACFFIYQAALGLQHAHEEGLVHRDIKPHNLMLSRKGDKATVKILDFGLAKAAREGKVTVSLTSPGQALGTPDYIAPEQITDAQTADIRADIYSLGGTLYFLLTGHPPFQEKSLYDLYQAHISRIADPLNLVRPDVPAELAAVVAKMMAKDPAERFQTPGEVAQALKPFLKPRVVDSGSSDGDRSHPGQRDEVRTPAEVGAPASAPAGAARVAERIGVGAPDRPGSMWKSLIMIPEPEHLSDRRATVAERLRRRPRWPALAVAAGVLLLGLIVACAAWVFTIKTKHGLLVLEGVPEQAEVLIDGEKATVRWPDGGGPLKITVPAGRRGVIVKKNGFRVFGQEVSVATGEHSRLTVRLVPLDGPPAPRPSMLASVPVEPPKEITNSIGMKLVLVPAGEFMMGATGSEKEAYPNQKPQHRVRITRPFYLGATEVTQGQYRAVTGANPSNFQGSDDLPVENVSWVDAQDFCAKLNELERGQLSGASYRLPTEAEWEYACRAGATTRFSFGDAYASLGEYAWFTGNSDRKTHPVGQKRPNAWGLYDMNGNVCEWCGDGYDEKYYAVSPGADPLGPSGASDRVMRGMGWFNSPQDCRSASRGWHGPADRVHDLGFRVARVRSTPAPTRAANASPEKPAEVTPSETPPPLAKAEAVSDSRPVPAPEDTPKEITNSIGMKLALIPAGEFLMGSPDSDPAAPDDEKPQHRVRITRPFYLGATEVTVGQFRKVVEASGLRTEAETDGKGGYAWNEAKGSWEQDPKYIWRNPGFAQTDEHPVVDVSWNDAIAYCNKLSLKEGLTPFYRILGERVEVPDWAATGYRLPTEAEWEYACRAGTTTRYESGDDPETLSLVGNIADETLKAKYPAWPWPTIAARDGYVYTAPVGRFRANAFGLYDMHGNVWEWCWDGYAADYYKGWPAADPPGPSRAADRVFRGGCWDNDPRLCRAATRYGYTPGRRHDHLGLRLARVQSRR
jgi:formylglycine-generating enzyme required for sulfatase activity/serine/threonine protein kinase